MPKIQLRSGTEFHVDPGKSILAEALDQGICIEYSCKNGRCGACKARVLGGATAILSPEEGLAKEDARENLILTCCRTAVTNVALDIEDLPELKGVVPKKTPAKIDSIELLSHDIIRVTVRTPPSSLPQFLAGQYAMVTGPQGVSRAYSVANAQRADGKLEFHIKKVHNGLLSNYWFNEAKLNDLLRLELPLGTFFLRSNVPEVLVLLATGTGFAPVKAILEHLKTLPIAQRPRETRVYWGNRTDDDIYLPTDQFVDESIKIILLLSKPGIGWNGRSGYVQNAVIEDRVRLDRSAVYACGSPDMIEAAKTLLTQHSLPSNNFYFDAFVRS